MTPVRGGERGAAVPIVALSMVVVFVATSFTVDLGRVMERRRSLQLVADLAALDAARTLDVDASASAQYEAVRATVAASAARNDPSIDPTQITTVLLDANGVRLADLSIDVPAAVLVEVRDDVDLVLQVGSVAAMRSATARAPMDDAVARLRLGSGLISAGTDWSSLAATDAPVLDQLVRSLLGGGVSLDVLGYRALGSVDVTLGDLGVAAGVGGDLDALLTTEFEVSEWFGVLRDAVAAQPTSAERDAAVVALDELAAGTASLTGTSTVPLATLVDVVGAGGAELGGLSLPVDRLVRGGAVLARDDAVVGVPGLSVGIPGLVTVDVSLGALEPERTVVGPVDSHVETAQVRVRLSVTVHAGGIDVVVPLVIEAASGTARLVAIDCVDGDPAGAIVHVSTSGARVGLGELSDGQLAQVGDPVLATAPVATLRVGPLSVPVPISVADDVAVLSNEQDVPFDDTEFGTTNRVGSSVDTGSLLAGSLQHAPVSGLLGPLLTPLLSGLTSTVSTTVDQTVSELVEPILDLLGVQLGYADIMLDRPDCATSPLRLVS